MFSNVCTYLPSLSEIEIVTMQDCTCEGLNHGVLQKGIYASIIKYNYLTFRFWDYFQQLNNDYLNSNRDPFTQYYYLNANELMTTNIMREYFFTVAIKKLLHRLSVDIDN